MGEPPSAGAGVGDRLPSVKRLPRAIAVTGATASIAVCTVGLSACSFLSPVQTDQHYNPGDGVPAERGSVIARNLVVVANKAGGPATLVGGLQNIGEAEASVGFITQADAQSGAKPGKQITLKAREGTSIAGVSFPRLDPQVGPGMTTQIVMITSAGQTIVTVPVLPAKGLYATLGPTG